MKGCLILRRKPAGKAALIVLLLALTGCQGAISPLNVLKADAAARPVEVATPEFTAFLAQIRAEAVAKGIDAAAVDRALAGLAPEARVTTSSNRQAEFVRPIWDYLDQAVNARRVENGLRIEGEQAPLLAGITRTYGVPGSTIMAIWAMESSYGVILQQKGNSHDVIRALATLAFSDERRGAAAHEQLLAALRIFAENDVPREVFVGSWAGAMGQVQFMPTTFLRYAVDFDGDGHRDIWRSVPDSLASAANYLSKAGWQADRPWGYEVLLPEGFDTKLVRRTKPTSAWEKLGVKRSHGRAFGGGDVPLKLILPAGVKGAAFLVTDNFEVIRAYNKSDAYALAVGLLSDRLSGQPGLEHDWPRKEPPLTQDESEEIQKRLQAAGLYNGEIDGRFGGESASAVRDYQERFGLPADGWPTRSLLEFMRKH